MTRHTFAIVVLLLTQIALFSCSSPEPSLEEKRKEQIEQLQAQKEKSEQELAKIHYMSGLLASLQLEYEEAEEEFREAVRYAPNNKTYKQALESVQKELRKKAAPDSIQ